MFRLKGSERETGSGKDGKQGKEIKPLSTVSVLIS